jgi:hypothetical protein
MKFNLVCDLTTGIHIGDLLEIDRSALDTRSWRLIELKEGKINAVLTSAIEEKQGDMTDEDIDSLKVLLGEKAEKQAKRMLRQRNRQIEVRRMVEGTEGMSPQYNRRVLLSETTMVLDDYLEAVGLVCEEASTRRLSARVIDGCLRILAAKPQNVSRPEDWMDWNDAAHVFYHLGGGRETTCFLDDPDRREEEITALRDVAPFVDLVAHNMGDSWGFPIFAWMEPERVMDLVMGRIRLFVQFDMKLFFQLARSEGVELSWVTKRPDDPELRKLSGPILGSPNAWSVHAKFSDGTEFTFLAGIFRRAIASLTAPRELIKLMRSYPHLRPREASTR